MGSLLCPGNWRKLCMYQAKLDLRVLIRVLIVRSKIQHETHYVGKHPGMIML